MSILAIDPSLTSTGYAYSTGEASDLPTVGTIQPKKLTGLERLEFLRLAVKELVLEQQPELVVYEGYAMSRFANRAFDLGELGGVLKSMVYRYRIPILIVPPTCLKLYATGKGNADKSQVMKAMAKIRRRLFATDDEADAYALMLMGLDSADRRRRPRDPRHHKNVALASCSIVGMREV